jgi:hypothetical protein
MAAPSLAKDRSGRVKVTLIIWLLVIGGLVYCGIEIGGVYVRKMKLEGIIAQELSFGGQRSDESIRRRVLDGITGMNLPAAARNFQFVRTQSPQALRVSISYVETVNLIFTEQQIPISIQARRTF